jgi:hypothetical protein
MNETQLIELYNEYAKYLAIMDLINEYGEDYIEPDTVDEIINL